MRVSISLFGIALVGALMHAAVRADKEPLFGPPPLVGIAQREVVLAEDQAGSTQDSPTAEAVVPSPPHRLPGRQYSPKAATVPLPLPAVARPLRAAPQVPISAPRDTLGSTRDEGPGDLAEGPGEEPALDERPPVASGGRDRADGASKSSSPKRDAGYASVRDNEPAPLPKVVGQQAIEGELPTPLPSDPGYSLADDNALGKSCPAAFPLPDLGLRCVSCCDGGRGDCCRDVSCRQCRSFRLLDLPALRCRGMEVGGWLDQGITTNDRDPLNRFNGPVTFNDRSNEYQMNQLYLYAQRAADTGGCGWDLGGRFDLLYGTDHRFAVASGLEDDWNRGQRFYGLAMPQFYLDVAVNDLTVRMGHFYTIIGYETVTAPDNFFYSHAYTMQYGEPFTHTGLLAIYELDDCWSFSGGFHRGWDNWEDSNDALGFLGGITWTSPSECTSIAFALTTSSEDPAGENNRFMYSLVLSQKLTRRLTYVFQHDLGLEDNAAGSGTQDAEWYGFNNYLLYDLNPCWSLGLRYEWFTDDDGTRVAGLGRPNGVPLSPIPSHWQELSLGLNCRFNENVMWRSECRWDWVDPLVNVADGPFNDFNDRSQFLWGNDLIIQF